MKRMPIDYRVREVRQELRLYDHREIVARVTIQGGDIKKALNDLKAKVPAYHRDQLMVAIEIAERRFATAPAS